MTISGSVIDDVGTPISGMAVIVPGKTPVVTDAGGMFIVPGVSVPYNIYLVDASGRLVIIYEGLTKTSPVFNLNSASATPKYAIVSGTVPAAPGERTLIYLTRGNFALTNVHADTSTGAYTAKIGWSDSATAITGTIQVFRYKAGIPKYDGYATKSFSVDAGGTSSANNFSAGDVASIADTTVSGTVVIPGALSLSQCDAKLQVGNALMTISATSQSQFSFDVPVVPGLTVDVEAYATGGGTYSFGAIGGFVPGTSNATLTLTAPPQLALPPNNATNIDTSTTFAWNHTGNGIYCFDASPTTIGPEVIIYTSALNLQIPDLSQAGVSLPANRTYTWNVTEYSESSVDDVASASFLDLFNGRVPNYSRAISATSSFTTKP